MKRVGLFMFILGIAIIGTGCPPVIVPPFNATGTFTGTWVTPDDTSAGAQCPITLVISHNTNQSFPRNLGIEVTASLDLSCHPNAQALVDAGFSTTLVLETKGVLDTTGQFILATPPCEESPCVGALFGGEGFDNDGDGAMDAATGSIGLSVDEGDVELFALDADFELVRQ